MTHHAPHSPDEGNFYWIITGACVTLLIILVFGS